MELQESLTSRIEAWELVNCGGGESFEHEQRNTEKEGVGSVLYRLDGVW